MPEMQTIMMGAAIVVGAFLLIAVAVVWMRKQVMGFSGSFLGLLGVVLMGLSIWKNVEVSIGKDGVKGRLEAFEEQLATVAAAGATTTESVQKLAKSQQSQQQLMAAALQAVQLRAAVAPVQLEALKAEAAKPVVDVARLQGASEQFRRVYESRAVKK